MAKRVLARRWCFTINNPTEDDETKLEHSSKANNVLYDNAIKTMFEYAQLSVNLADVAGDVSELGRSHIPDGPDGESLGLKRRKQSLVVIGETHHVGDVHRSTLSVDVVRVIEHRHRGVFVRQSICLLHSIDYGVAEDLKLVVDV